MPELNRPEMMKALESTINMSATTWETRLQAYWQDLFAYSLGSVLCVLVICITIFSKHITGDYKWFVLNQALVNFFCAIGNIAYTLVVFIWYTPQGFGLLLSNPGSPLWVYIFQEAMSLLMNNFGRHAAVITLFATVFNRWMAIAMPDHYRKFMSARLIVLYCTLCYVVVLPASPRVFSMFSTLVVAPMLVDIVYFLTPWLLSIILSLIIFFKLWNHMRTTKTILDVKHLQESRMVLYSLMIQIAVLFFEEIPHLVNMIRMAVHDITEKDIGSNLLMVVLSKMAIYINMYTNAYTCIIILITMPPYRRAVLSLISPITKFCLHHLKLNIEPATTDNREAPKLNIVNVRPAWNANSL